MGNCFDSYSQNLDLIRQQPEGSDIHSLTKRVAKSAVDIGFKSEIDLASAQESISLWISRNQRFDNETSMAGYVNGLLAGRAHKIRIGSQLDNWLFAIGQVAEDIVLSEYPTLLHSYF